MSTVLITGSNRGIGLEFARQYGRDGWRVIATCRNPIGVGELATIEGDIQVHGLDVTDERQIASLAGDLEGEAIDLLINNAGRYGPVGGGYTDLDRGEWHRTLETNAMAPLAVSATFLPHVTRSEGRKIVTLTSKMGSMGDNTSGGAYIYRSSKAALNAVMKSFANDVAGAGVTVAVFHPGWVKTAMGGPNALITAEDSVTGIRRLIDGLTPSDTGAFFNYDGTPVPW